MEDVPRGTMDEVSSHVCLVLPSTDGKAARKIVPPRLRIPYWKGLGADSEEKHEPVSDIDTVVVDSLKALDPKRPIREADIHRRYWTGPRPPFLKKNVELRLRPTPRSADRARSLARVSEKREYFKCRPETIGDFAPKLFKLGV